MKHITLELLTLYVFIMYIGVVLAPFFNQKGNFMRTLQDFEAAIKEVEGLAHVKTLELEAKAQNLLAYNLHSNEILTDAVKACNNSTELTEINYDDSNLDRFVRIDLNKIINVSSEFERNLFSTYMDEKYSIYVDYENNCFLGA